MRSTKGYANVYKLTKKAMLATQNGYGGHEYDGYYDANAVSYYLDQKYNINVLASTEANDAFCDAFNS